MNITGKQYYEMNFGMDEEVYFGEANVIKPIEAELVGAYYRGTRFLLAVSPAPKVDLFRDMNINSYPIFISPIIIRKYPIFVSTLIL